MHLWRGMEVTDGLILTTDLSVTDNKERFRVGIWGGTNARGSYKEFDYYLSCTYRGISLAIWDIYNFSPQTDYNNEDFFNYKARETGRFIDVTLFGTVSRSIPLKLSYSTIVYGRDRNGLNSRNRYSTFAYAEYTVWSNEQWTITPGMGAAFALSPGRDEQGILTPGNFYGETAGIVHVSLTATYHLHILDHEFPLYILALWNPQADKGYLQEEYNSSHSDNKSPAVESLILISASRTMERLGHVGFLIFSRINSAALLPI